MAMLIASPTVFLLSPSGGQELSLDVLPAFTVSIGIQTACGGV